VKVRAPFRLFGELDDRTRANLVQWLRKGPAYDSVSWSGRDVDLYWRGEIVSRIIGPFGEDVSEVGQIARQHAQVPFAGVESGPTIEDEFEAEPPRKATVGETTHRHKTPWFIRNSE
jgi:hypothetical protein